MNTLSTKHKHCDLLSACVKMINNSPLTFVQEHVKGHQDTSIPAYLLPLPAQLNVWMDGLAKQKLHNISLPSNTFTYPHTP